MTVLRCFCGATVGSLAGEDALHAVERHVAETHGASFRADDDGPIGDRADEAPTNEEVLRWRALTRRDRE